MSQDIESKLYVPNKIPEWVENHRDKFNSLVYKSLKQQNRLYEVAMQKMLFGSLSKDVQEKIKKEIKAQLAQASMGGSGGATGGGGAGVGDNTKTALFIDGKVPDWIEAYRDEFSSMVYKSLKAQKKLTDANMQKMLFGSLSQEVQDKIKKKVEEAKKAAEASAAGSGGGGGGGMGGNSDALLEKISSQLEEVIGLLKDLKGRV